MNDDMSHYVGALLIITHPLNKIEIELYLWIRYLRKQRERQQSIEPTTTNGDLL
jgi:hypothetical protein